MRPRLRRCTIRRSPRPSPTWWSGCSPRPRPSVPPTLRRRRGCSPPAPDHRAMPPVLPPRLRNALRPLAITFVPAIAGATAAEWSELERRVTQALVTRPSAMRRQLGLFVRVLEAASRIRYRTGLAALDPGRRIALLETFVVSPRRV